MNILKLHHNPVNCFDFYKSNSYTSPTFYQHLNTKTLDWLIENNESIAFQYIVGNVLIVG